MNVAVVGGGLAGLVAAHELVRAGHAVTLMERDARLGGQLWTERSQGFLIEHGAEGFAAGSAAARDLCAEVGLTGRPVSQCISGAYSVLGERLVALSSSEAARLAGIQANATDFGQGIASFPGGMTELVDALVAAVAPRAHVLRDTAALDIAARQGQWEISTSSGRAITGDALILALHADGAARLLSGLSAEAGRLLESFRTVSSVTVSLGYPAAAVTHPLDAAGFVSPSSPEAEGFKACSIASAKFPGRAPEGHVLLRAFFRPGAAFPMDAPDARWSDLAAATIGPVLDIRGAPHTTWVTRWPCALPRYRPDHEQRVQAALATLHFGAPLALAGAAFRLAGIGGAIESARRAVAHVLASGVPA